MNVFTVQLVEARTTELSKSRAIKKPSTTARCAHTHAICIQLIYSPTQTVSCRTFCLFFHQIFGQLVRRVSASVLINSNKKITQSQRLKIKQIRVRIIDLVSIFWSFCIQWTFAMVCRGWLAHRAT